MSDEQHDKTLHTLFSAREWRGAVFVACAALVTVALTGALQAQQADDTDTSPPPEEAPLTPPPVPRAPDDAPQTAEPVDPAPLLEACREETDPCLAIGACRQAREALKPQIDEELNARIDELQTQCSERQADLAEGGEQPVRPDELPAHITTAEVEILPGRFEMGSSPEEPGRSRVEKIHRVTITRPFVAMTTEVTQGQWEALMGTNPSVFQACGAQCPVENINWYEAVAYANARSEKDGLPTCYENPDGRPYTAKDAALKRAVRWPEVLDCAGWRLPTEAEWEYMARAGSRRSTTLSDRDMEIAGANHSEQLDRVARYGGNSSVNYDPAVDCSVIPIRQYQDSRCGTFMVGIKEPNVWGLYDTLGNVWEWTWDEYAGYPETSHDPINGDPTGTQGDDAPGLDDGDDEEGDPKAAPDDGAQASDDDELDEPATSYTRPSTGSPPDAAEDSLPSLEGKVHRRAIKRISPNSAGDDLRRAPGLPERVTRGCSWLSNARHCRLAYRGHADPGLRINNQGVRLVKTLPVSP